MNKWFYFNFILFGTAVWQVLGRGALTDMPTHILLGLIGFLLFLFNWSRHAVFSTIRDTPDRGKKIRYANLSKKVIPYHRYIGSTALLLVIIHAVYVLRLFGFSLNQPKLISGLVAGTLLIAMVATGWWRLIRPSGKKRKAHLYIGMTLFFLIFIHIIL